MNPSARPALVAAATALLLTACSAGSDPEATAGPAATPAPITTPTEAAPSPAASPAPSPSPSPTAQVIDVTYAGGELSGVGPRVDVPAGEQVLLRVTSDVAEEIHVHGYDLYLDVPAGGTGELSFVADLPGSYEVELHDAGRPVFQLRVA